MDRFSKYKSKGKSLKESFIGWKRSIGSSIREVRYYGADYKISPSIGSVYQSLYANTPTKRRYMSSGMRNLVNIATKGHHGEGVAMGIYEKYLRSSNLSAKKARKIDQLATAVGRARETGKYSKIPKLLELARKQMPELQGVPSANSISKIEKAKYFTKYTLMGGNKYGSLLNRRTIIGGATALAIPYAIAKSSDVANYINSSIRTQATGSGNYGTDTRGMLGPAGLEGLRFRSRSRRRTI
jgi:hypothetical protein